MPKLFEKPLQVVEASDLTEVIGWPESLTVEFKEKLPGRDGRDDAWLKGGTFETYARDKIFKEIVAFANTEGGHLLLGVEESDEALATAKGLQPLPRCVELAERLSRAAQNIDPPIPSLQIRGVETGNGAGIIVFRVPASRSAPHRSTDKECYVRRGSESVPVGMREIQDLSISSMRREEHTHQTFIQSTMAFHNQWLTNATGFAFRITAVPIGSRLQIGRIFGMRSLYNLQSDFLLRESRHQNKVHAKAIWLPDRRAPILRGERRTYTEDGFNPVRIDVKSDGTVDLWFSVRSPIPDRENSGSELIPISWIAAYLINVLLIADALRNHAAAPDTEYAVEFELCQTNGRPLVLHDWGGGWDANLGRFADLPITLPKVSFGQVDQVSAVTTAVLNDIFDAAGVRLPEPFDIELEP